MSDDLSLENAKKQFATIKADYEKAVAKAQSDYLRRRAMEFIANHDEIKKTMREQRERRTVRVKSKLP